MYSFCVLTRFIVFWCKKFRLTQGTLTLNSSNLWRVRTLIHKMMFLFNRLLMKVQLTHQYESTNWNISLRFTISLSEFPFVTKQHHINYFFIIYFKCVSTAIQLKSDLFRLQISPLHKFCTNVISISIGLHYWLSEFILFPDNVVFKLRSFHSYTCGHAGTVAYVRLHLQKRNS